MRKDFIVITGICLFSGLLSYTSSFLTTAKNFENTEKVQAVNTDLEDYFDVLSYCEDNYICEEVVFAMYDFDNSNSLESYARSLNKLKSSCEIDEAIVSVLNCSYDEANEILIHSSEMENRRD